MIKKRLIAGIAAGLMSVTLVAGFVFADEIAPLPDMPGIETIDPTETTEEESTDEESTEETSEEESTEETSEEETEESSEETTTEEETTEEETTEEETTTHDIGEDTFEEIPVTVADDPAKFGTLYWPLPGEYGIDWIVSPFGMRDGTYPGMHWGMDIGAPEGTPIYACEAGTVIISGFDETAGNWVVIDHENGLYTEYMHMSVRHVSEGDTVVAGQLIGLVGDTGQSTGPHLHLGVVLSDYGYARECRVDPLPYLTEYTAEDAALTIDYYGGEKITSAAKVSDKKIDAMKELFTKNQIVSFASHGMKKTGAIKTGKKTTDASYLLVKPGIQTYKNAWVKYEGEVYDLVLTILATKNETGKATSLAVSKESLLLSMGENVYSNADLSKIKINGLKKEECGYLSAEVTVEVYKHGTTEKTQAANLYTMIKDLDYGEAVKFLNAPLADKAILIKKDNTFAEAGECEVSLNGSALYAGLDTNGSVYNSNAGADAYVKSDVLKENGAMTLTLAFQKPSGTSFGIYRKK